MRSNVRFRFALLAPLVGALLALVAVSAPAAQAAFGVETFVAANCSTGHETCGEEKVGTLFIPEAEPSKTEAETQGYTQAGGHPAVGITAFKVKTEGALPNEVPSEGKLVTHVRTDVSPGVSTNPEAVSKCTMEEFGATEVEPGSGFYPEPQMRSRHRNRAQHGCRCRTAPLRKGFSRMCRLEGEGVQPRTA